LYHIVEQTLADPERGYGRLAQVERMPRSSG